MLCTLKIKLMPTLEQFHALLETMKRFNQACNYISEIAFRSRTFPKRKSSGFATMTSGKNLASLPK